MGEFLEIGTSHLLSSSEVTLHSLGIGKRFSALDSVTSSDFVSGVMLRCSYPILSGCLDIEYVEALLPNPEIVSVEEENGVEEENVVQHDVKEEEVDLEDIS
nr:hypothetical protein [Tanacetum cinerariifolium]